MTKVLFTFVLVFGMFACGEKKAEPTTHVVDQPQVAAPAPTPVVTKDATPVITAPAAPEAMLEEGMSMDATPVPVM